MSDAIRPYVPRSFRADRKLIAQLTQDPQLIRYIESMGIDTTDVIPSFLDQLLSLIVDAIEIGSSSQGTANSAARIAQQALEAASASDGASMAGIGEAVRRRLDELETMILDMKMPVIPPPPAQTPPFVPAVITVTAAYSVLAAPPYQPMTVRASATSGAFSVLLPAAPTPLQMVNVKKIDASANAVTINGNSLSIDGAPTVAISTQYRNVQIQFNGVTWDVL